MVAVWLLFTVMLFVAEPLIEHRWLFPRVQLEPEARFTLMEWLHRFLLIVSLSRFLALSPAAMASSYSDNPEAAPPRPSATRHPDTALRAINSGP
jgi:hypothetical protein